MSILPLGLNEIYETHLSGMFYPSKLKDLEQETKSPFLSFYRDKLEKLLVSDTLQNPFSDKSPKKRLLQQRFLYESFEVHCCEALQHFQPDAGRYI